MTKKELKEQLNEETEYYGSTTPLFLVLERDVLKRHLILLRKAEYYNLNKNKLMEGIYKFRLYRLQNRYALHIPLHTCKKGLQIPHLGPIIINRNARIGENARIHVGVNIGASNGSAKAPIIGNNVYFGPGAKVFGEIEIADNVQIGANAVVNKNCLQENVLLAGIPAKMIR